MKGFSVCGSDSLSFALFVEVSNSKNKNTLQCVFSAKSKLNIAEDNFTREDLPAELIDMMQSGKLEPEVAFFNTSLIPDVFPVLAAAHKTLVAKSRESLTTCTFHSELVYNYSGSKHITEFLKRCGISDSTTFILAAWFNASLDDMKAMEKLISGKETDLEELGSRTDKGQIQKHYKISGPKLAISSFADAIACRITGLDAL